MSSQPGDGAPAEGDPTSPVAAAVSEHELRFQGRRLHVLVAGPAHAAPGILLLTVFGDGLLWLTSRPTAGRLLVVAVLAGAIVALSGWIRRLVWRARA